MEEGYKLHEIDQMDIHFYLELTREPKKQVIHYADQVTWL
jgi:hypothetical protein